MPTQLLAIDTGTASSADVTLAAGEELLVCLNDAKGPKVAIGAAVAIELKDADGKYWRVDLMAGRDSSRIVSGPATYRFTRLGQPSCGVFSA